MRVMHGVAAPHRHGNVAHRTYPVKTKRNLAWIPAQRTKKVGVNGNISAHSHVSIDELR